MTIRCEEMALGEGILMVFPDELLYPPDERFDYNNVNYILLGKLIEKLFNKPYHEAIKEIILTPLKLEKAFIPEPQADPIMTVSYAKGYLNRDNKVADYSPYYTRSWAWSDGNMISTVDDLLDRVGYLSEGALLEEHTRKDRFTFLPCIIPEGLSYGMGITSVEKGAVGHSGNYNFIYTAAGYRYKGYDIRTHLKIVFWPHIGVGRTF